MRKTQVIKLIDDGAERVFRITQMPATKAERWINKVAFLIMKSGKGIDIKGETMELSEVMKMLSAMDYAEIEPLYNELIGCCTYIPSGSVTDLGGIPCSQETIDAQIVDPMNLYKLRVEALKLNFGFFMTALQSLQPKANSITFSKTSQK